MVVEIIGGIKSNSLAVLTDAAHMFSDMAGFAISLFAVWASGWKATSNQSFGFYRLEVLAALLSVQLIWLISGILTYEAIDRILHDREKINGKVMFLVAALGFLVNLTMVVWLGHNHENHHHSHHDHKPKVSEETINLVSESHEKENKMNINLQGAYLHVVTDLIQSIGVMIAGAIIWVKPNWVVIDLVCTSAFSLLVLISTLSMLENVLGILMERVPREIDIIGLEKGLNCLKDVSEVHDLHVWSLTVGKIAMSCHVLVEPGVDSKRILHDVRQYCEKYRIYHVTVQVEQK
ncbi:metal tolerance protein B [Beta vulgaris subsp. vulgaris]|uniref:metal tolerance protein B n=1 Tax=Beta vulgaris subsp. vulgaris TaxID=3555 RepID=UPI0020370A4F|nr:metal tolerance protein B [Beta vulgaris subsp. vulgaris]